MPWHLSKYDPRKVYNERHETVCVCQNSEQSGLIVRAVNALPKPAVDTFVKPLAPDDDTQELIPIVKPDLTALRDAAQGDGAKDASFAVSRRR
jgi:hypothetical protein